MSLWDVASRREIAAWRPHSDNSMRALAFSPDGRTLATGSWNQIKLWDVASRQEVAVMEWHSIFGLVDEMSFSPDGTKLASAARDSMVRLWDVASRQEIAVLEGHRGAVDCVAFSPDGAILASGSSDRTIRLWDAARREEVAVLEGAWPPRRVRRVHARRVDIGIGIGPMVPSDCGTWPRAANSPCSRRAGDLFATCRSFPMAAPSPPHRDIRGLTSGTL